MGITLNSRQLKQRLRRLKERQHWGPGDIRATVVQRRQLPNVKQDLSPLYRWLWLLDGEANCYDEQNNRYALKAGDCFIRAPGQAHRVERPQQEHYLELALVIPPLQYQALCACEIINPQQRFAALGQNAQIIDLFWTWFSGLDSISSPHDAAENMQQLHDLLLTLQQPASPLSKRERALSQNIQQALCAEVNRNIPIEDIAIEFNISMDAMRQLFRKDLGCLPKDFQIRRRCEAAAELLLDESLSIAAVAESLAYPDAFSFSKQFRKTMGMSPRTYRQQNAQ